MRVATAFALLASGVAVPAVLLAQAPGLHVPPTVVAGNSFAVTTEGSGAATLYIVSPAGALRRQVQLGSPVAITPSELYAAGQYTAILSSTAGAVTASFAIIPAPQPATISFLASPSRLPVGLHGAVSGTAYLFDAFHNLITTPLPVSFELSVPEGATQSRTATSNSGVAHVLMDSATRQGSARFVATSGGVSSTRVLQEVPGDPCGLTINATPAAGRMINVQTAPIHDCSGNPVPDGTVVTFTESAHGTQSTVDAPIKQGIARALLPASPGARISVASGVVAGNEIRWAGGAE